MKSFIWLATFLLIPLGCTTTNQELNVNKDYVVQVISLKGERHRMEKLFKCPNGCKKICSNVDFNSGFSACLEQTDVAVTRYPLVYLNLGENQVIDQLESGTRGSR